MKNDHPFLVLVAVLTGTASLLLPWSCTPGSGDPAGMYLGIILDAAQERQEILLVLTGDHHYRYRAQSLGGPLRAPDFLEGTWYQEEGVIGLMRPGYKDIRYIVRGHALVAETPREAFPELSDQDLSLFRVDD